MTQSGIERELEIKKNVLQTDHGSELNIQRIRVREVAGTVIRLEIVEARLGSQIYSKKPDKNELKVETKSGQSNFPPPHWEPTVAFLLDALDDEQEKKRILFDLGIRRSDISEILKKG